MPRMSRLPKLSKKQLKAAARVEEIMQEPGWGKLTAAVKRAAKELGMSERTVWAGRKRMAFVPRAAKELGVSERALWDLLQFAPPRR